MSEYEAQNAPLEVIRSIDARDLEALGRAITDDCEVLEVPTGEVWKGIEGITRESDRWEKGFPDFHSEIKNVMETGDWVVFEAVWIGTHEGDLVLPEMTLSATGKPLAFPYCTVAKVRDNKQESSKHYYDVTTITHQLGLD